MSTFSNQPTFSIRKALSYGFKTYFNNIWLVLGSFLIIVLTMIASNLVFRLIPPIGITFNALFITQGIPFFFINIIFMLLILLIPILEWIVAQWLAAGFIKMTLELHDTNQSSFKTLFSCRSLLPYFMATSLIYTLMISIGFVCLIIPGIYLMTRYHFAIWSVVDGHAWIIDAFKYSSQITRGIRSKLFVYGLAFIAISIIPIFIPVGIFGLAYIFRWAQQHHNEATIY